MPVDQSRNGSIAWPIRFDFVQKERGAFARHELACDGVGVTSSDNSLFKFEKVRRPIFPLDPDASA